MVYAVAHREPVPKTQRHPMLYLEVIPTILFDKKSANQYAEVHYAKKRRDGKGGTGFATPSQTFTRMEPFGH